MPGAETLAAALGGLSIGLALLALALRARARSEARRELERDVALRRRVLPVLERRADMLGIPPAQRGSNDESPFELAMTLATAIGHLEESADLPFGDTVEVSRSELDATDPD